LEGEIFDGEGLAGDGLEGDGLDGDVLEGVRFVGVAIGRGAPPPIGVDGLIGASRTTGSFALVP